MDLLRPLPLDIERIEKFAEKGRLSSYLYYSYLFGCNEIRPVTLHVPVQIDAFDSEEERQKAYAWLEQVSGGDSNG